MPLSGEFETAQDRRSIEVEVTEDKIGHVSPVPLERPVSRAQQLIDFVLDELNQYTSGRLNRLSSAEELSARFGYSRKESAYNCLCKAGIHTRWTVVNLITGRQNISPVLHDKRGRIIWQLRGNTLGDNEMIGILNMQMLFLEKFPEFNELFPRGEDGKIAEDKRSDAREFILRHIDSNEKFAEVIGILPPKKRSTPYFEGSRNVMIEKSFLPWGIEFKYFKYIDRNNLILFQKEGLARLSLFLTGKVNFSYLQPFILSVTEAPKGNNRLYFYIGKVENPNPYLSFACPPELSSEPSENIFVVPKTKTIEGKWPYYWLEFYLEKTGIFDGEQLPFNACRINPEDTHRKIDFQNWHNIEEQLLADYLSGENNISFEDLMPFTIRKRGTNLVCYRIGASKGIELSLHENPLILEGDMVKFVPREDDQKFYQWISVLKILPGVPEEQWPEVASYRLLPDKGALTTRGWFGPERQLLIDYLSGNSMKSFENLRPIRAIISSRASQITIGRIGGTQVTFPFPKGIIVLGEEVIIVPRQDEQKLHQWLELYKINPTMHMPEGGCLALHRILYGKIQGGWKDPETRDEETLLISPEEAEEEFKRIMGI